MQIVLRGKMRCMTGGKHVKRENKGLREKINGTKAKEEHVGSRGIIKGAAIAKGESKMREGDNKIRMGKIKDYGGKYKVQIMLRGTIKCMTDKMKCEGRNKGLREKIKGT